MSTAAENARQAHEDEMMRAIAQQAAAARQRQQEMSAMRGDRAASQDAAVRAAQVQADAQIRAAEILAQREAATNAAIGDRQIKVAELGQKMTEAQRAQIDMAREDRELDPKRALMQALMPSMRTPGAVSGSASVADAPAPVAPPAPSVPYDTTGFNADVQDIAQNVRVARNQSPGMLSYDDLPTYERQQGAFVRDPTGQMRQVHFPGQSRSSTPDRAAVDALKAKLIPQSPIPSVAGVGAAAMAAQPAAAAPLIPDDKRLQMLTRLAGVAPSPEEQLEFAGKAATAEDVRQATKLLRTGQFSGEAERQQLIDIIESGGGVAPKVTARGQIRPVDEMRTLPEYSSAVKQIRDALKRIPDIYRWDTSEGEQLGAQIASRLQAAAAGIATQFGGDQTAIARAMAEEALRGEPGNSKGFLASLGRAFAEVPTFTFAETQPETVRRVIQQMYME
jgi:hypothetical protein